MTRKLDVMTALGLALGLALIVGSIVIGGSAGQFWNLPSLLITIGGSTAAVFISYDLKQVRSVMNMLRAAFFSQARNVEELTELFVDLAKKARREGLLGLEDDIQRLDDPFFQKGIRLMVDAVDPEIIRDVLETDMEFTNARHELGQGVFKTWAALSPAFGMLGTLIGLIQMLANLNDPSQLGPGMALALVTTFYGSLMANLVFTPLALKLGLRGDEENLARSIILEGIIAIQSGINPRILEEKLRSFVPPAAQVAPGQQAGVVVGQRGQQEGY